MAAVLEMTVRDLLYGSSFELKRSAINWILYEGKVTSSSPCFSFYDCIEYLDLSGKHINYLINTAISIEKAYDSWIKANLAGDSTHAPTIIDWPTGPSPNKRRIARYTKCYTVSLPNRKK